jgi:hypothetical protein
MAAINPMAAASPGDRGCAAWNRLDRYWVNLSFLLWPILTRAVPQLWVAGNARPPMIARCGVHSCSRHPLVRSVTAVVSLPDNPSSSPSFAPLRCDNPDRKGPLGEVRSIAKDRGGFDSRAVVGRPAGGLCCGIGKQWSEGP